MTVPSMFSMNRAVAMMRAVRRAERMGGFRVGALVAPRDPDGKAANRSRGHNGLKRPSAAEHDLVHDPSRREREEAGDDEREGEDPDHRLAMAADVMAPGAPDSDRNDREREQRQEMDRTPTAPTSGSYG